jgi:SAM-dependent methyltransferase
MSNPISQNARHHGLYNEAVWRVNSGEVVPASIPCIVCGGTEARPYLETDGGRIVVLCTSCGLGRMEPLPSLEEIRGFYPGEYYGDEGSKFSGLIEWLVRVTASRRVRFLIRQLPRAARVLDVGCGRGTLLSALANRGFEVHGFEISPEAAEFADPRAQVKIGAELAEAEYPAGYFDMVVVWHVLEHLKHPEQIVAEIHRILKPGGKLIIAVPNFSSWQARWAGENWFHLDLPRHLYHFPFSGLRRLVEDRGFDYRSAHFFSLRQNPFGWVQSAMNRLSFLPRNALYSLLLRSKGSRFGWRMRIGLLAAFLFGMPLGVGLSILSAAFRRGATVHVVWQRDGEPHPPETP